MTGPATTSAGSQIVFAGNPGYLADDNLIAGNYIGLDANGQALAGATNAGVFFDELTRATRQGTRSAAPRPPLAM